ETWLHLTMPATPSMSDISRTRMETEVSGSGVSGGRRPRPDQVAHREHPDQAPPLGDREMAVVTRAHRLPRLFEIGAGVDRPRVAGHPVGDRVPRGHDVVGDGADDVPLGQ